MVDFNRKPLLFSKADTEANCTALPDTLLAVDIVLNFVSAMDPANISFVTPDDFMDIC